MKMRLNRAATERSGTEQHEFIKKLATLPSFLSRSFLSRSFLSTTLALTAAALLMASGAQADITPTGDVSPDDPNMWTSSTRGDVGLTGVGTLVVDGLDTLKASYLYIGNMPGSMGTATITGGGAGLELASTLYLARYGTGTLNITNGATAKALFSESYVGYESGSLGTLNVDGTASTSYLTTGHIGYNGTGILNITNGAAANFNSYAWVGEKSGSNGAITIDGKGSNLAVAQQLTLGYSGTGALKITNGGALTSTSLTVLGKMAGSAGTATVSGLNSKWISIGKIYVGYSGTGSLIITDGGTVTGGTGYLGYSGTGASGTAIVDGSKSTWASNGSVNVGSSSGTGKLSISDGGTVSAKTTVSIGAVSTLSTDVGKGSSLIVGGGTGTITNNGKIRLVAGAGAAAGAYTPMSYGTMSGTGTVQALGGVWNSTAHTVAVGAASTAAGNGGAVASFNTATAQRALVTDSATGKSVGAGFQAGTSNLTFGATAINGSELTSLQGLLTDGKSILSGWDFTTSGYTAGDAAYLSLWVGGATSLSDMSLWKYVGGAWSQYTGAYDLAYDGTYASFTATDLNTWAVTGTSPVPVPGAVWLLGSGVLGLVGLRKRRA